MHEADALGYFSIVALGFNPSKQPILVFSSPSYQSTVAVTSDNL